MFNQLTPNYLHFSLALLGFVASNILCLVFSGQYEGHRQERAFIFTIFNTQLHFHHWMYGALFLAIMLIIEQYTGKSFWLDFLKGVNLGLVFHGLAFYSDYFDILKFS
jgi:hypothetical protein